MTNETLEYSHLILPGGKIVRPDKDHVLVVSISQRRSVPEQVGPVGARGAPSKPGH